MEVKSLQQCVVKIEPLSPVKGNTSFKSKEFKKINIKQEVIEDETPPETLSNNCEMSKNQTKSRKRKHTKSFYLNEKANIGPFIKTEIETNNEDQLLEDDAGSIGSKLYTEDELLNDDFLPPQEMELDYNDNDDDDNVSIFPDDNEFNDEVIMATRVKRRLDEYPKTVDEKVIDWKKSNLTSKKIDPKFKIPKFNALTRKEIISNNGYEKNYITGKIDRKERNTRKNEGQQRSPLKTMTASPNPPTNKSQLETTNSVLKEKLYCKVNMKSPESNGNDGNIFKNDIHKRLGNNLASLPRGIIVNSSKLTDPLNLNQETPFPNGILRETPKIPFTKTLTSVLNANGFVNNPPKHFITNEPIAPSIILTKNKNHWITNNSRNMLVRGVCHQFEKTGTCQYGVKCRFKHIAPSSLPKVLNPEHESTSEEDLVLSKLKHISKANRIGNCVDAWVYIQDLHNIFKRLSNPKNDHIKNFKNGIEMTMLQLSSEEHCEQGAEIAHGLIEIKRQIKELRWEDLIYAAKIQSRHSQFHTAIELLNEISYMDINGNEKAMKETTKILDQCIESSGKILDHWDGLKKFAVHSDSIMTKIFSLINKDIIEKTLTTEDLNIVYSGLCKKKIWLSSNPKARAVFLELYLSTPNKTFRHLMDLFNNWSDLSHVPSIAVEKLLQTVDMQDALKALSVLQRIPHEVSKQCSKAWNELLENFSKEGNLQIVEQLFGLMHKAGVKLEESSSCHMLQALCRNNHLEGFVTRFQEIEYVYNSKDFVFPDWFASTMADVLERYTGNEINVPFVINTILVMSRSPPPEEKLTEVLHQLQTKRRFQDVLSLVKKCFDHNVILSQLEIRKIIQFLEEWKDINASIYVYQKMREIYPRPEYFCFCGKSMELSPRIRRSSSFGDTLKNTYQLAKESLIDSNNTPVQLKPTLSPSNSSQLRTKEHLLMQLSAEMQATGSNITKLVGLYLQAIDENAANNDKIVNGIYLALECSKNPSLDLKKLYDSINNIYNPQNTKTFEFPEAMILAFGRVGIRLIKSQSAIENIEEAYNVLTVLHEKEIRYRDCGRKYGSSIYTQDNMSLCQIAILFTKVCYKQKQYASAIPVLSYCSYGVCEDQTNPKEIKERNEIVRKIIEALVRNESLVEAWEVFYELNQKCPMSIQVQTKLANDILKNLCTFDEVETASKLFNHMKTNNIQEFIDSTKAYINCLAKNQKQAEALQIFKIAISNEVYDNTYSSDNPLSMKLSTDLTGIELDFMIDHYVNELRSHPIYGQNSDSTSQSGKPELLITVETPYNDDDDISIEKTQHKIIKILCEKFHIPLDMIKQRESSMLVPVGIFLKRNTMRRSVSLKGDQDLTLTFCPSITHEDSKLVEPMDTQLIYELDNNVGAVGDKTKSRALLNTSSADQTETVMELPPTAVPKEAKTRILKTVCSQLSLFKRNKRLPPEDIHPYSTLSRNLFKEYMETIEDKFGCVIFNNEVALDISRFLSKRILEIG